MVDFLDLNEVSPAPTHESAVRSYCWDVEYIDSGPYSGYSVEFRHTGGREWGHHVKAIENVAKGSITNKYHARINSSVIKILRVEGDAFGLAEKIQDIINADEEDR